MVHPNVLAFLGSKVLPALVESVFQKVILTRTFCGKMCGASCGIIVTTEEGRIVKVEGDPDYPPTKGYFCVKGKAITELIYHPDRLTKPLRKVGPRGSGQWEEITAGEAVSHITDKLRNVIREHGSESVAFHLSLIHI